MRISFKLNNEDVSLDIPPETSLLKILHKDFNQKSTRQNCGKGRCGNCMVLINGEPANACLLPAFNLRGQNIVTIEGLREMAEFKDITKAFIQSKITPCPHCAASRALIIHALVDKNNTPSRKEILKQMRAVECPCLSPGNFFSLIQYARQNRERRLHG